MPEQPTIPETQAAVHHTTARKIGAATLPAALLMANNMPVVGHQTEAVTSTETAVVVESEQVPVSMPADPGEFSVVIKQGVDNEYRVDFQTTESDARTSEDQTVTQLGEVLSEDDWSRVYDIEVRGLASAEDEQADGGLQQPSDANTNLALQRALIAAKPVIDTFAAKGIDVMQPVEKEAGTPAEQMLHAEGIEDSWSDDDMGNAEEFVSQFGYEDVKQMVQHYNDGGAPPAVEEFLDPLLKDKRGAEIILHLRDADGEERTIMTTVERERVEVKEITEEVKTERLVSNNVIGRLPENPDMASVAEDGEGGSATTPIKAPSVQPPVAVPGVPPEQPPHQPPPPRGRTPKDVLFRQKQRAPQGNGAKPLRYGGGVPYNPTPSNFAR